MIKKIVGQVYGEQQYPSFFATMIFVFIGTGSVVASKATLGEEGILVPSLTVIALAHGFTIMVLIYSIGEISGGHINPAVTWALLITDRLSIVRAVVYWHSQILGGIVGSALLLSILPPILQFTMGCHDVNPLLSSWQGLGCEIMFTFIFIFIVFATAVSPFVGKIVPLGGGDFGPGKLTPFAVGMTIMILHCVGIPLTGASMNPARSFAPAVVAGCWDNQWVYWFGPLIGSTVAAVIAQVIFLSSPGDITAMLVATRGVNFLGLRKGTKMDNKLEMEEEVHHQHEQKKVEESFEQQKGESFEQKEQLLEQRDETVQVMEQLDQTAPPEVAEIPQPVEPDNDALVKIRLN